MVEPTTTQISEHQRFQADLPFYVNGTLTPEEHAWMDDYIGRYPLAQSAVDSERSLRAALQAQEERIPYEEKVARFLREMPTDRLSAPSAWQRLYGFMTQTPATHAPSLHQLWQNGVRIPAPAFALLAALVVGQAAFMAQDALDEGALYRNQTLASCQKAPALKIIVKPETRQADLVVLLRKVDANIVAGPSEMGELWLAVSGNRAAAVSNALEQLRSSALLNEALPLPITPCKP